MEFDRLMHCAGIRPVVAAAVDDMAMLRLPARESDAPTLVPPVVTRDKLEDGSLVERCRITETRERFYAVGAVRRKPHPRIQTLLGTQWLFQFFSTGPT